MLTFIRVFLMLPSCVALCAAVGVCVTAGRFGVQMLSYTGFFWTLLVGGGVAGFLSALLAPGWKLWERWFLLWGGSIGGAAAGAGIGFVVEHFQESIELLGAMS